VAKAYTQRFCLWQAGTGEVYYQVPAGYRIVVKSLTAWAEIATSAVNILVNLQTAWFWSAPGAYTSINQQMQLAVYAGERLRVVRNGAGMTGGALSGYVFVDHDGPIGSEAAISYRPSVEPADELESRQLVAPWHSSG
jgi:hypothetical protein